MAALATFAQIFVANRNVLHICGGLFPGRSWLYHGLRYSSAFSGRVPRWRKVCLIVRWMFG